MSKPSPPAPASNRAPASAPTGSKTNIASTVAAGKRAAGSTAGSAASGTDVATVSDTYINIWRETPYTSYVMFDYLLKNAPVGASPFRSWETFLASQEPSLADAGVRTVAAPTDDDRLLWNGQSGLCTSFAIRVATEAKVAQIQYGSQSKTSRGKVVHLHRAGWEISGTSAIVIDSSARQAIHLEDISQPFHKDNATWAFKGDILSHTNAKRVTVPFTPCPPRGPEGWKAAMQICLEQLLPKNDMILMFRSVKDEKVGFAGTVLWNFQKHRCTFSTLKAKDVSVVEFGDTQTAGPHAASGAHTAGPAIATGARPATEPDTALQLFWAWINQEKVPSRKSQFSTELQRIHSQLWQAAVTRWGTPKFKYFPNGEPSSDNASSAPRAGGSGAGGSGAAASGAKKSNAKAPVNMKTAPGTQPVPGGLSGSLLKVGLDAFAKQ